MVSVMALAVLGGQEHAAGDSQVAHRKRVYLGGSVTNAGGEYEAVSTDQPGVGISDVFYWYGPQYPGGFHRLRAPSR